MFNYSVANSLSQSVAVKIVQLLKLTDRQQHLACLRVGFPAAAG